MKVGIVWRGIERLEEIPRGLERMDAVWRGWESKLG